MDISDKDKFELEKRSGDSLNYHSASMSWDWRFGGANLTNTSMSMVQGSNPMAVCKGDLVGSSSCSSASVVDSYGPNLWDHPANSQTLGFCDMNVQNNASTLGIRKVGPGSLRMDIDKTLDIGWNPPSSMLKGGIFLPNAPGMLPQSMSQFPADSAFIERAARSSCFNGGDFSDMMNPFSISESLNPYSRGGGMLQQDVFANNGLKSVPGGQSQKDELSMAEISEDVSSAVRGAMEGSPLKNKRKSERLVKSIDEAKQGIGVSGNESDEAEFSGGGGGQEEPSILEGTGGEPSSSKGLGSKKKKRSGQDTEIDQVKGGPPQPGEASKDDTEIQHKGDQNPSSVPSKDTGKHGKQGAQASDPPKEEYTHVRARRAGLTNNHSLAERVRREKISERMKFLQDLVPGCNKITGKAVMLDEIINYVQSLQRQVEIMVQGSNPMAVCKGDLVGSSSCSSASVVDSYGPNLWDHPANSQTLGFCDMNVQNNASTSSTLGIRKVGPGSLRMDIDKTLDIGWNPPSSMLKGGIFLPNAPGMLPQSLSQFPADSAFIERAARFSCFNGGNFSDMMNPFSISESLNPYSRGGGMLQQDVFANNGLKSVPGGQSQKDELSMAEISKDVSSAVRGAMEGSPLKNERKSESLVKSIDEAKQGIGVSGNESDEAEFSGGGGGQEEPSMLEGTGGEPTSGQGLGSKKRKRSGQDTEIDQVKGSPQHPSEASKDNTEIQHKGDQNPSSVPSKNTGKHGKQGAEASDPPKEEYIHVRARRGQATNSHSLAERVRREKISERMKFLQDLVPGCSKVTGKAVMLDEIINYVQSLQRQVEFLSMKLATVNPRLDFNIEGILGKDILQPRVGPSTMGFSSETTMPYPQLHPSQSGLIQVGLPGLGNSSDAIRRTINSQLTAMSGGYKESTSQLPNVWEDELHNVVQMGFSTGAPLNSQDLNGSLPPGHMKAEL